MLARQGWAEERAVMPGGMALVGLRGPRTLRHLPPLLSCYTSGSKIGVEPSCPACEVGRAQRVALICSILQIRKLRPQENTLHDCRGLSIVKVPTVYHSLRNGPPRRQPPSAQLQQSREHCGAPTAYWSLSGTLSHLPSKSLQSRCYCYHPLFLGQEAEAQTD